MTKVECSQSRAFENMKPGGLALVAHGCKLGRCIAYSFGCSTRSVSSGLDLSSAFINRCAYRSVDANRGNPQIGEKQISDKKMRVRGLWVQILVLAKHFFLSNLL